MKKLEYTRGLWVPRLHWKTNKLRSPTSLCPAKKTDSAVALVWLTDPDTKKRSPEFMGNYAIVKNAPQMYALIEELAGARHTGYLPDHQSRAEKMLAKIRKDALQ